MAIDARAAHVLTDVAKFSLRIGSHAARSGVAAGERIGADSIRTGLHLSERALAVGVDVGEKIERPAVAAMLAAGIEVESLRTDHGRKVHYDFFAGVTPEILNPGGALPGANDWGRPMSKAHPNPVILMHGTAGGAQTNWFHPAG
jgi:triacylglycerol lipase